MPPTILNFPSASRSSSAPDGQGELSGVKVLLVEDCSDLRSLFARIFRRAGADCVAVDGVSSARDVLHEFSPDVIVSDIGMPEEDGISFIKSLRESEDQRERQFPAIAVTAFDALRATALNSGFDRFLVKPTAAPLLVRTILSLTGEGHPQYV